MRCAVRRSEERDTGMRLGLNQPYFFPYIGHYALIKQVDLYIIDDIVQFTDKSWMTRNRILKPQGGWQYIIMPVKKHSSKSAILEITVDDEKKWKQKILKQLDYYRRAPFFSQTYELVEKLLNTQSNRLSEINENITRGVCAYLGIDTPIEVLSRMKISYDPPQEADEWGLNLCRAVPGVTEYWNAPGGASFYDRKKYRDAGIEIKFQKMIFEEYPQKGDPFEPGLSILDVMMFNDTARIRQMMDHYELI